jgi:hypothetical protein
VLIALAVSRTVGNSSLAIEVLAPQRERECRRSSISLSTVDRGWQLVLALGR